MSSFPTVHSRLPWAHPEPRVRVELLTTHNHAQAEPGPLKLTATIDPLFAAPLTPSNLLRVLAGQPFALLTVWFRILYNAWILHYIKRLDVYERPDPHSISDRRTIPAPQTVEGVGVRWQSETWVDAFARRRITTFLKALLARPHVADRIITEQTRDMISCGGNSLARCCFKQFRITPILKQIR